MGSAREVEDLMSYLASLIRSHPLVSFFVLAYALSWWPAILYALDLVPQPIVGFGPFLAALLVLAITRGKTGVVTLLRRMVRWRVGLRWYVVALLLPVTIALAAAVFNVLLGAQAPSAVELGGWTGLFSTFFILLLIPGLGGTWEEPGWRGYALPRLQVGLSALLASLILGVLWAFWHLPLMVVGEVPWSDIVFVISWTVVFTWLFNTRGSVLLAMLIHAMNNTISGSFFGPMFSGADSVRQGWLYAALWCAVAVVLVVECGPQHLSRKHSKQEEDPVQPEVSTASPRVV